MGLTRRELFAGPAAAVLAGGLGASCGGALRPGRTALTAAGPPRPVPCGVDAVNVSSFEALTGTFATYLRVYHGPRGLLPASLDDPPAAAAGPLTAGQRGWPPEGCQRLTACSV